METSRPNYKQEFCQLYKLKWWFHKSSLYCVEYIKTNDVNSFDGQVLYAGIVNGNQFGTHKLTPIRERLTLNEDILDNADLILHRQLSTTGVEFTFFGENTSKVITLPPTAGTFSVPKICLTYHGHHICILPSMNSGFFNSNLCLEARLIFPHALDIKDTEAKEDIDYTVLWTHECRRSFFFRCSASLRSAFSIKERLIEALPLTQAPLVLSTVADMNPLNHPSITTLDLEYSELLLFFFSLIQYYHTRYSARKSLVTLIILTPLLIGGIYFLYVLLSDSWGTSSSGTTNRYIYGWWRRSRY